MIDSLIGKRPIVISFDLINYKIIYFIYPSVIVL